MKNDLYLIQRFPDNCPPRKIALRLGLGFLSRLGLVLGFGRATRQLTPTKIALRLGLVLWLGDSFPRGQLS